MSPISVSLFLDPQQIQFDLVVFDEASQICSEDSVGAIYRGKQLVVCGDNRQLPPTSFFDQGTSGDDFDEHEPEDAFDVFESILDECSSINLPQLRLRWHYRSRHESLITFSNRCFYSDQPLVTFPSASGGVDPFLGVEFVHVPDGVYDRSGRRDNEKEADKVAQLVLQHLQRSPDRSLGVVAFSIAQRDAIEDRLERVRKQQPELEQFFSRDKSDRVFVKNLESVQGDERDVIIFSVGYGRDRTGKLTMHFGPLNQEGGERRLNVAVTRAREKVVVVSSIRAADMDVAGLTRPGVLNLYRYLDYAERGIDALEVEMPQGAVDFESPLEESVGAAIRSLGYQVVPQVGCSGYRIDLGVLDPTRPGRFMLGVECDGAMYHSAYTARDRDRLRQEQLERLGWRLYRIWGPDWVARRESELKRLADTLQSAVIAPSRPSRAAEPVNARQVSVVDRDDLPDGEGDWPPEWARPYTIFMVQTPVPKNEQFHWARATLIQMLDEVVENEGPIHIDLASRRLAERWGFQRVGARMSSAVEEASQCLVAQGGCERRGDFLWPKGDHFALQVRRPVLGERETLRPIEHIPSEEVELALTLIVQSALSLPEEELVTQAARLFGFDRTGSKIRANLGQAAEQAVRSGKLVRRGGRLSCA